MERYVFRGVSGIIVEVTNHRVFKIMPVLDVSQPLVFDPNRFIDIDLDATPLMSKWKNVQLDDRGINVKGDPLPARTGATDFNVTSLGNIGSDLVRGRMVGAAYVEDVEFQKKVRPRIGLWPPTGYRSYELTTVAYSPDSSNGPRASKRYAGFHAKLGVVKGDFGQVTISRPPAPPLGPFWIDFSSGLDRDYDPPIDPGDVVLQPSSVNEGALFLELSKVVAFGISNPKLPIGLGG